MSLTATVRKQGSATILDLSGRITLGESTGSLREMVRKVLDDGSRNLILNMVGVSYVDSAGLGELVGSFTTVANRGGRLKLLNLQAKMKDLMQITKLHTVFEVFEDEPAAVKSFSLGTSA
jgi:anti-sigma B factor antagonist